MLKKIRILFVQARTDSQPDLCVEILDRLREAVDRKTNERGASTLFLHRGNVIPRWALSLSSLHHSMLLDLNKNPSPLSHLILHPVTCGSFKIRSTLKLPRFLDIEDGHQNVIAMLKIIPKQQFHKCFQKWRHCWIKCTAEKGWLL